MRIKALFILTLSLFITPLAPIAQETKPVIKNIFVKGNKHIKNDMVLSKIPYVKGKLFDQSKSADAIHNLYALGYFKQIQIEVQSTTPNEVELFIVLNEKKLLEKFVFIGNKSIKTKEFFKQFNLDKKEAISAEDLAMLSSAIKQKYQEEGFYFVKVDASLEANKKNPDKITAKFNVKEGVKSSIIKIAFKGNERFPDRKLRNIIFTREKWLMSILDSSGKYSSEEFDLDSKRIEQFYKDQGYLMAKVTSSQIKFSEDKKNITAIFEISEGDLFNVRTIEAPGDDIFLEEKLLPYIPLEEGKPYSQSKVMIAIEKLKDLWGEKGYINADVYPQVKPDEETKTVDITFYVDRGNKVRVRRINITGNEITKDKIIRRKIEFEEGDVITRKKLQKSQNAIEHLSYFERGGVNWKMHRINDELADIELNVKETLTGNIGLQFTYGGQKEETSAATDEHKVKGLKESILRGLKGGIVLEKRNFMGEGFDVGFNSNVQFKNPKNNFFELYLDDQHLLDSNIAGRFSAYRKKEDFDEWVNVDGTPSVMQLGGSITLGFVIPKLDRYTSFSFETGLEAIDAEKRTARGGNPGLQTILNNSFISSHMQWFGLRIAKDTRNHMIYPSNGYKFEIYNRLALPGFNNDYSFIKSEAELSYYAPLIGEDNLVLGLHSKFGVVYSIGSGHIPYQEYYHMGGLGTVRGFRFGEIGPAWRDRDPIGARNAFQFNTELIFPILPDYSMKGYLFYDAGSGWNTDGRGTDLRLLTDSKVKLVTRNKFNFRQSVGFGISMMQPQPMKIAWGYKLDRDRKKGESPSEFHLSANIAF